MGRLSPPEISRQPQRELTTAIMIRLPEPLRLRIHRAAHLLCCSMNVLGQAALEQAVEAIEQAAAQGVFDRAGQAVGARTDDTAASTDQQAARETPP